MSHRAYRVHPTARRDLKGFVVRLVLDRGSAVADEFVEAARRTFIRIGESPMLGSPVESRNFDLSGLRKRSVPDFPHVLVFYQTTDTSGSIRRVLSARQDWSTLLDAD